MACLGPHLPALRGDGEGAGGREAPLTKPQAGRRPVVRGPSLRSPNEELQGRGPVTQQLAALPSKISFFLPKIRDVFYKLTSES